MKENCILFVDDDQNMLESSKMLLSDEFLIKTASSVNLAKNILDNHKISTVVVDLNFEGHENDGIDLIDFMNSKQLDIPTIVLSGDKDTFRVVEATKRNLVDFIIKDGDHEDILRNAIRRGLSVKEDQQAKSDNLFVFKSKSPAVKEIFRKLDRLLSTNSQSSILINGESGTGKEYLAKYISSFLGKRMVAVNMASIPKETAESELFGHIKGSFTGAITDKKGKIEEASNGVFFLDEIGDCSLAIQSKLLRATQEKEVLPVGANIPRKVNTRFIAATHKNLSSMVENGQFRLDLLQRLSTFTFEIPPLRQRPEDIKFYANLFIEEFSQGDFFRIKTDAMKLLLEYDFPGNVRELRNIIERAVIFSENRTIDKSMIKTCISSKPEHINSSIVQDDIKKLSEEDLKDIIVDTINKEKGNRTEAAKKLGVDFSTLYRWVKKYKLESFIQKGRRGNPNLYCGAKI